MGEKVNVTKLPHHEPERLCETRPPYRQGRRLTAVKVYTVNDESQHLLICGVPKLQLKEQVEQLLSPYGNIKNIHVVAEYPSEEFTETFHVQYARIQSARIAKHFVDRKNFYGGLLHVCYAPELESITETREKLFQRRREVLTRIKRNKADPRNPEVDQFVPEEQYHRRKKTPALPLTQKRLERFYPNESLPNIIEDNNSPMLNPQQPYGPNLTHDLNCDTQTGQTPTVDVLQPPYKLSDAVFRVENVNKTVSDNTAQRKRKNYKGKSISGSVKVTIMRPNIIDTRNILKWDDTRKNVFTNAKKVESGITIKVAPKSDDSKKRILINNPSVTQLVQPSEELQLSIQSAKNQIRSAMQKKDVA